MERGLEDMLDEALDIEAPESTTPESPTQDTRTAKERMNARLRMFAAAWGIVGLVGIVALTFAAFELTDSAPAATSDSEPKPAAPAEASETLLALQEQHFFEIQNAERVKGGVAPLTINPVLSAVARERADDMAAKGYVSHTSPDNTTAFSLLVEAKYGYALAAENVGSTDRNDSSENLLAAFMGSPRHRASITNPAFKAVGVAIAYDDDTKYVAVIFAGQ